MKSNLETKVLAPKKREDTDTKKVLSQIQTILSSKKCENISILNLENVNSYLSYFVICTVLTNVQASATARDLESLDKLQYKNISAAEKRQDMSSAFRFGLAREFFQGFANEARCNLHLELLYGEEPHHVAEVLFKAFAKSVDFACQKDPRISGQIPSTKGAL